MLEATLGYLWRVPGPGNVSPLCSKAALSQRLDAVVRRAACPLISLTDAQPPAAAVIACLHQAPAEVVEIFGPTPERRYEDYRVALSTNRDIDGRLTVFTVCCRLVPDCAKTAFNDTNERAAAYKNRLNLTKIYALILTKASIANEFCRPQSGPTKPTRKS